MQVPDFTVEHLKELPLRAIVAFAARCARRVEPLALLPQGQPRRENRRAAVEAALCLTKAYGSALLRADTAYWHEHIAGRAAAMYFLGTRPRRRGNSAPFPSASARCGAGPETLEALDATLRGPGGRGKSAARSRPPVSLLRE